MMQALTDYLCGEGAGLFGSAAAANRLRLVKASDSPGIAARIKFFVFCGNERHPRLVCHVARHVSGEERIRREWLVRHQILARIPSALRCTIPRPLALESISGALVLVEQGLPGTSFRGADGGIARRRRVRWELESASFWIQSFQDATKTACRAWTAHDEEEHVLQAFAKAGRWLRLGRAKDLAEELRRRVRPLRGHEVAWPAQHGDLWHGNMLRVSSGIAVVDWEVAQAVGPAFVDPLAFAFQYLFWHRDPDSVVSRRKDHPQWLRSGIHTLLHHTLGSLAEDAARLDAAFLVSLLARSQLARPGEGPPIALKILIGVLRAPSTLDWLPGRWGPFEQTAVF